MTYLDKLKQEHPDVYANTEPSCIGCPDYYGLEDQSPCTGYKYCEECWNREIPEEKETYSHEEVKNIFGIDNKTIAEINKIIATPNSIKDSGDRTEFATGAVRDMHEGKGRMDLLPWAAIMEISKHCENGARKYGEHNVDKGIPTSSLCDSAARHLAKYLDGWTDEPHLIAAAWNLLWAIQMEQKHPELCNTPWEKRDDKSL